MLKQNLLEMTPINHVTAKPFSLTNQAKVPNVRHFGRHLGFKKKKKKKKIYIYIYIKGEAWLSNVKIKALYFYLFVSAASSPFLFFGGKIGSASSASSEFWRSPRTHSRIRTTAAKTRSSAPTKAKIPTSIRFVATRITSAGILKTKCENTFPMLNGKLPVFPMYILFHANLQTFAKKAPR